VPETAKVWRERQLRDPETAALITLLERKERPERLAPAKRKWLEKQASHYTLVDGALYGLSQEDGKVMKQIIVPNVDGLRQRYLRVAHGYAKDGVATKPEHNQEREGEGAHEGGEAMFHRLRRDRNWKGMRKDCDAEARKCHICREFKAIKNKSGLLQPTTGEQAENLYAADWAGPLQEVAGGYKFVFIAVEYRTGWPWAVATKDVSTDSFLQAMNDSVTPDRGVIPRFRSDRGSSFTSEMAEAYYKANNIKTETTASYNPQANGMAENMVKQVIGLLKKKLRELGGNWKEKLPNILTSIRAKFSGPRGMSPYRILFGREMLLPSSFDSPITSMDLPITSEAEREKINEAVSDARDKAGARYKKKFDRGRVITKFTEGDWVWLMEHEARKMEPKRSGPYRISKVISDLDVEVEDLPQGPQLGRRHNIVNVKNVEKYNQEVIPAPEEVVREIIKHRKRRRNVKYLARWSDGDETWQPARDFIDREGNGEFIINEALKLYWAKHPTLAKEEGYPVL
jgi:hypothetical protein